MAKTEEEEEKKFLRWKSHNQISTENVVNFHSNLFEMIFSHFLWIPSDIFHICVDVYAKDSRNISMTLRQSSRKSRERKIMNIDDKRTEVNNKKKMPMFDIFQIISCVFVWKERYLILGLKSERSEIFGKSRWDRKSLFNQNYTIKFSDIQWTSFLMCEEEINFSWLKNIFNVQKISIACMSKRCSILKKRFKILQSS